jgi:hypothetical protein
MNWTLTAIGIIVAFVVVVGNGYEVVEFIMGCLLIYMSGRDEWQRKNG